MLTLKETALHGPAAKLFAFVLALATLCAPTTAQEAAKPKPAPAVKSPTEAPSKTVKADSVTINMPEGMTRDQADAILTELKAIHQLLLNQQATAKAATAAVPAPAPVSDKVQMKMASGWQTLGRDDAPVTLVEFTDYQCPFCRKYHTETFAELKKNYIDTGKLRFVSRDLPLDFHPFAQKAAEAAHCAAEQNKYWELRDAMIVNSTDLSQDAILKYAKSVSLDLVPFRACLDAGKYKGDIQKDMADAGTLGISGTPSFVIGKTSKDSMDGDRVVGAVSISVFDGEIQKYLAK
jgi:protein-disulfide isomerase